jgi:DUF4097 and DUF4098 domain-containing protein YvlB
MRTTTNTFALALVALFVLLISFGCADISVNPTADVKGPGVIVDNKYKALESFSYTVDLSGQTTLKVEGINGSVNVQSVSGTYQVTVSGEKVVRADTYKDAADHLKYVSIVIDESTDELLVKTVQPKFSDGRSYNVNYTISIPSSLNIVVDNVNGSIALDIPQSTSADFFASLVNGGITVQNLILHNKVATSKSLQGTFGNGDGTISLRTTNGNIDVSGF